MPTAHRPPSLAETYRLLVADTYEFVGATRRASDEVAGRQGHTTARWNLLSVVSDGPRSAASAARRLGLARQSVQRVAHDLVEAGLLRREPDPTDARAPLLVITEPGREVLAASVRTSDATRTDLLARAGVSASEMQAAREVLRRLTAAAD